MGCALSKPAVFPSEPASSGHGDGENDNVMQYMLELSSYYEEACQLDPDLRPLGTLLGQHSTRVFSTLAGDAATVDRSLSRKSIKEATDGILCVSHNALSGILELKDEISANPDLLNFVKLYFKNSVEILKVFTALKERLARARETESLVHDALRCYEKADHRGTVQKLREFKAAEDPFTAEFFVEFRLMLEHQRSMLSDLKSQEQNLDNKLRKVWAWRKVWGIFYVVAYASIVICSVVLAAVAAPSAATAATAGASTAAGPIGDWIESLWDKWERGLEGQQEAIRPMGKGTFCAVQELENIRLLAERLHDQMHRMVGNAEYAAKEEGDKKTASAVTVAMEAIKYKIGGFTESMDDLEEGVERCSAHIRKTIQVLLQTITNST